MESVVVIKERKEVTFPLIARRMGTGLIVLFTNDKDGVVLVSDNRNMVGTYSKTASTCFGNDWEILEDVTINFKR